MTITDLRSIFTIGILSTCLDYLSGFLLLTATLLPITRLMYECAGGIVPRGSSISHKILIVLIGPDLIACIALLIWLITDTNVDIDGANRFFSGIYSGLTGIFIILYAVLGPIGSLMGFINHIIAIRKAPQLRRSGVSEHPEPLPCFPLSMVHLTFINSFSRNYGHLHTFLR